MLLTVILFFISVIALWAGAKWLVQGSAQLAARFRIPSILIGLTIVAWGTSSPEVAVTLVGAWKGEGELVIGNIVGSNIFNLLFILGLSALMTPIVVKWQLIRLDVPLMIVSTLFFWFLAFNQKLGHLSGLLLLVGMGFYLFITFRFAKKEETTKEKLPHLPSLWMQIISIVLGLILLIAGSELFISQASKIARSLGVSELLIGLTLLAGGTSLPELVTTLMALRKGENDIAIGHIVGSNISNLLGVMGLGALLSPQAIEIPQKALTFDIPIMIAASIGALPIFFTGHRISRWEGILFLFYYALYLTFLLLEMRFRSSLFYFTTALFFFIIPLTILTVIIGVVRHFQRR